MSLSHPFSRNFRPHPLLQDAHDKMLQTLCGIFDTNCFELCPSGAGDTISGVFPAAAMMMHRLVMVMMMMMMMMMIMMNLSCYKNSRLTFSDDHVITIMARTVIKAGEAIYHTYARTFNTTTIRRIGLFQVRRFPPRCAHSTPHTLAGQALQLRVRALQGPHRARHLRQRRPLLLLRMPRPRHRCRPSRPHQVLIVDIMVIMVVLILMIVEVLIIMVI